MESFSVEREIKRPLADFPANIWDNPLIFFSISDSGGDAYKEKHSALKGQVMEMLMASKANPVESLKLIDVLCRLGVSYNFEKEIEDQLNTVFGIRDLNDTIGDEKYDLSTVGIIFQVLRQFGHKLSADVFERFRDENGKFKENSGVDAKGMLSLYEAAHWSTHGEDILDEALIFSKSRLQVLASKSSPHIRERIKNTLKHPYPRGITRIETRQYISYYQEEVPHDETLLKFAKLDFNILQLLHREELAYATRWYKDLKTDCKVPYARNRIVECYLWALGTYFEPQYSRARIIVAITIQLLTILDDTYDAYGTMEELELFTDALNRWLPTAPEELPDNMKYFYSILVDYYDKLEEEMEKEGRSGCGFHVKKSIKSLGSSYYQEAKWSNEDYIAMFDEYKENGVFSNGYYSTVATSFAGMTDVCKLDVYEWLSLQPKVLVASEIITRFMDDITSYEFEHKRKHVGTAIDCYMKQYGVSKEKATEEIERIISETWKDLNQELMRPYSMPRPILIRILNLTRVIEVFYKYQDSYTHPEFLKDYVVSLFTESIPV
ncbi:PREDICTED: alpha-humulene/(-)-(E)-beta-caryophyllene synthase-like [Tarenaya hassleriana]|uniref:alpha-humulene/(-)-(E)-beta-caryophyllene synthase-like n=1 Tax=Tarenaya hassleriana TaxID=28532 RepID=UPI00053C98C5|nr:PREDICTED: alpha-humulene/(-)-(E)-beta-caryophyllene synthase-like [Tarenaya hassleriana]